ncbi:unnamed protein product [Symbiodinium sp. CCMP2592]|nr:unnamed protein product [Symbiodinium sp. CCMP2592]
MASNLFDVDENKASEEASTPAPVPKAERRVKLYSWDSVAAQLLEPFGECALDNLSLAELWKAASEGNRKTAYHSHLCADKETDKWRVGAGVSMTSAALLAAIKHLESDNMRMLIRPELYEKIIKEATDLKPSLEKLNLGRGSQKYDKTTGSLSQAKRQKTGHSSVRAHTEEEVMAAVTKFHGWLAQEKSALRGALFVLSGSNTYYTGHAAEVVARACIIHKPLNEQEMRECMRARLAKPAEEPEDSKRPGTDNNGLFD